MGRPVHHSCVCVCGGGGGEGSIYTRRLGSWNKKLGGGVGVKVIYFVRNIAGCQKSSLQLIFLKKSSDR